MLLIAGKGHETGQIVGKQVLPFSDHEAVAAALAGRSGMTDRPLWTVEAMAAAMRRRSARGRCRRRSRASRSTRRTIAPGEAFFAIKGDNRDGHDFVAGRARGRRRPCGGRGRQARRLSRATRRCSSLPTCSTACAIWRGRRARASQAKIIAVTGSVGKTGTKEALRLALARRRRDPRLGRLLQQSLGRAAVAGALPATARYAVFEIGMNHAGEIEPLTRLVRPHVAIITTVEPVHLEFFGSLEAIADAKAEIFLGLEPGGAAVINRDNPQFARLERGAKRRRRRARRLLRRARATPTRG